MSKLEERQFPARALLTGLRAIGYSFATAVADIIDNSISAQATEVKIYSDPLNQTPYFCILDNGLGMSAEELDNAMLPGSNRDGKEDSQLELGRFGLGLKSASLSQCREFIVVSKQNGQTNAMSFDLDVIEASNKLLLKRLSDEELDAIPHVDYLQGVASGTIVVWTKFDKLVEMSQNFEDTFRRAVADAKKHIELVFHRFYNKVAIYFNDRRIERRDPFLLDSVGRQQTGRTSTININGSEIVVTPYTLPFANTLTTEEKNLLGNPKSIYDEQGFYLYRNERLISWGSWMRMGVRSELNKLARIRIDIPSSLDSVWMLDVKKSSAKIPDKIRDRIRMAVEDSIVRSKRTTRFPGEKEQAQELKIWERVTERDGVIRYEINRESPAIATLLANLGEHEKKLFEIVLSQLECYIPKYSIVNDNMDSLTILNSGDDAEEEHLIDELIAILSLCDEHQKRKIFERMFMVEGYQKLLKRKDELRRRIFGDDD